MASIEMRNIVKQYGDGYPAVNDVSLDIADGEFMILVGPSGCGKSTLLRMIVGLEDITSGDMIIGGARVNDKAPRERNLSMVFQNYALYPHMTVFENIAFPLRLKKGVPDGEIRAKVAEAAATLELTEHLQRKPGQLSGGQRQRVAMGRAIVREPAAFLMDEPLSNLDAKLRVQTRTELARIQQRLGTTTVYVTHDQTEALTLGDRVAVMRAGVLEQVDTPMELYTHPRNVFVAGFIGSPAMNFMPATVEDGTLKLPMAAVRLPQDVLERVGRTDGKPLIAGIRPEDFEDASLVGGEERHGVRFRATIDVLEWLGAEFHAHFSVGSESIESAELRELAEDSGAEGARGGGEDGSVVARLDAASAVMKGQEAELWLDMTKVHLFDPEDGRSLTSDSRGPAATEGQSPEGHAAERSA